MFLGSIRPKILPLTPHERKLRGKKGVVEEGVIEHIFSRLQPKNRFCIEIGAGDGVTNSFTRNLIEKHGFGGVLVEADPELAGRLKAEYRDNKAVTTIEAMISRENVESLLKEGKTPEDPDFMLIDIDGNDLHVWRAIENFKPRVVCIEYNPSYPPGVEFVIEYREDFVWNGDDYYGASFSAICALAGARGYELAHCTSNGDNLIFVLKEAFKSLGQESIPWEEMYQIPQYGRNGRGPNGKGHPTSLRNSSWGERIRNRIRYRMMNIPRVIARQLHKRAIRKMQSE